MFGWGLMADYSTVPEREAHIQVNLMDSQVDDDIKWAEYLSNPPAYLQTSAATRHQSSQSILYTNGSSNSSTSDMK